LRKKRYKIYPRYIFISLNFDIYNDTALSNINMNMVASVEDDTAEI